MHFACFLFLAFAVQDDASALIRKLGSENLEEREAATNGLLKLGKAARPAILDGVNHKDPEISRRAKSILERLEVDVEFTLSHFDRAIKEEKSQARLLQRLQGWAKQVFEGKCWDGIPEALESQGLVFHELLDYFDEQKRTGYRYLLRSDALQMPGGAKLDAHLGFEISREVNAAARTRFTIRSATISFAKEINEDVKDFVSKPRFGKDTPIQMAIELERFGKVTAEFPFVRSIEMTWGPQYRIRDEWYSTGINLEFEVGSPGNIWSSSYHCDWTSGLEPDRNHKTGATEAPFDPADTLTLHIARGSGKSGPRGNGLKRMDLPQVRDPFSYMGHSSTFYHTVYSISDLAALPDSARRIRFRIPECSAEQLKGLRRFKSLQLVGLNYCTIDDEGAQVIGSLVTLDELWLSGKGLTDRGFKALSPLVNVKLLYVTTAPNLTDDALSLLKSLPRLRRLNLNWWGKLTDEGMKHIGDLAGLEELELASLTKVTDAGIEHLAELQSLKSLEIRYQENLSKLSAVAIGKMTGLQDLTLYAIDDSWLPELAKLPSLAFLCAYDSNGITNPGLMALKELKNLRRLNIHSQNITEAGLDSLRKALPGVYVTY